MVKDSQIGASPRPAVPVRSRTIPDRILGLIGGAMIAGAIGLLLFGGARSDGAVGELPALRLVTPVEGDVVQAPLTLTFRSELPLTQGPSGWGTGEFHLHAKVGDLELMPGPSDVIRTADGGYQWTLPWTGGGVKTLRLFWSDANHIPVVGVDQAPISVRIVGDAGAGSGGDSHHNMH